MLGPVIILGDLSLYKIGIIRLEILQEKNYSLPLDPIYILKPIEDNSEEQYRCTAVSCRLDCVSLGGSTVVVVIVCP